ncbi:ankyrin repeat domain-containing protein [Teredinibacter haidensis]|uniref:ankyrin repeat domain-containing protein n=1 Tax=Teredinibacter haidensis TaxID=2731755 RepID=UPI000948AE06|nr:ankyrin repeat domain-containing protein [Teredinibacter haidensis]
MDFDINYGFDFRDMSNEDIIEIFDDFENIDSIDDSGDKLLLWACKGFNKQLVMYALNRGADTNYLNECGETPVQEIVNVSEHKEELALSILQLLISAGANLELRAYMEKTAFLKACSRNSTKVIELLVKNGADVKATVEEHGKLLDGNFYAGIFGETSEIKRYIKRLVNS